MSHHEAEAVERIKHCIGRALENIEKRQYWNAQGWLLEAIEHSMRAFAIVKQVDPDVSLPAAEVGG